jgi:ubiquinone/menaquinone biosynthesis C-methylase UbiE
MDAKDRGASTEPARATAGPDLAAVRDRQQAAWSTGNYAVVGNRILLVSELLCEAADLRAGWRVLDVATGSGNAALAAARRWCEVVGTDYVPALLEQARVRAAAEGLTVEFREADAEKQPFPDASFDAVLSVFGAMFAPDQDSTAAELARVCRPGGRIALASWTPEGFAGRMFLTTARHVPPPPGLRPPVLWGTPERIEQLFGRFAASIVTNRRNFAMRFRSPAHQIEVMRTWFGPTVRAFEALDPPGRAAFERDFLALLQQHNQSGDSTTVIPSEYLEVVIARR